MPTSREQSAIAEVRDQLSLDYADGKHLNAIGGNYGLPRPVWGYTDDMWRALIKELAVEKKQVRQKFREILATLFGPQITEVATLKAACSVGDSSVFLNFTGKFPQLGTLVIDRGLATEETIRYSYIDRTTGEVFLESQLGYDHAPITEDSEQPLLIDYNPGESYIFTPHSAYFPTSGFPVTLLLGRQGGYTHEAAVSLNANNVNTGRLTISPVNSTFKSMAPSVVQDALSLAYATNATFLSLQNTTQFPETGVVLVGPTTNTFAANAAGAGWNDVPVAASTFTADRLVGYRVVFTGNVTATLAGLERRVRDNTATLLTLSEDLPDPVAIGDTFRLKPVVEYVYNDTDTETLTLRRELPAEIELASLAVVELLETVDTVSVAQVTVTGVDWDIYQVDPRHIEIYLPDEIQDPSYLRNSAYLHTNANSAIAPAEVNDFAIAGDELLPVITNAGYPQAGVITIDPGGPNEEVCFFYIPMLLDEVSSVALATVSGASRSVITLATGGLTAATLVGKSLYLFNRGYEILTNSANTITLVDVLPNPVLALATGASVQFLSGDTFAIPGELQMSHDPAEVVELYQPSYASTDLLDGNLYMLDDVFPGPYMYQPGTRVATPTSGAETTLAQTLGAKTKVVCERYVNHTAVEVEDATTFPLTGFPYNVVVGRNTGNRETVVANAVNLKQRALTAVTGGPIAPSTHTVITVSSTAGTGANDAFPNVTPYRVRIGRGTANDEVCLVEATSSGPATITVVRTFNTHNATELVELLGDVISVDTLNDEHRGYVTPDQQTVIFPEISSDQRNLAETVEVAYDSVAVTSVASFPESGFVIVNPNTQRMDAKSKLDTTVTVGSTAVPVDSTDSFPPTSSAPYKVRLGKGKFTEEIVTVSANNTGTDTLTITHGARYQHNVGELVEFLTGQPQVLEYTSVGPGNVLQLSSSVVVESDHHAGEGVVLSLATSDPDRLGYDFAFRMPPDVLVRIRFLFDLVRAAGVQVSVINKR